MSNKPTASGRLVELRADECWELAASRPVGRLAWTGPHGPTVIPVNFSVDGRTVVVHTKAYSEAGRECEDSPVAFEVDSLDDNLREGWSVLMRGHAYFDYGRPGPGEESSQVWVEGPRSLRLRVDVATISGRRLITSDLRM